MFNCLFLGIIPGKLYSASCGGREVNPLGVVTHGQWHKPRAAKDSGTSHVPVNLWLTLYKLGRGKTMNDLVDRDRELPWVFESRVFVEN